MSVPPYNSPPGGGPYQGASGGYEPVDHGSAGSSGYGDGMGEQTSTFRSTRRPFGRTGQAVPVSYGQRGYDPNPGTRGGRRRSVPPTQRPWWQAILTWQGALLVFMSVFALGVASFAVAYAMIEIPKLKDDVQKQATTMYYNDGNNVLQKLNSDRIPVDLKKVPVHVQRAFLAAEDKTFYDNPGFSIMGMGRAVMASLRGGSKQGGSTITQQYVKNAYLNSDQNISRKLKELIISIKLENGDKAMSKNDIFEGYLNAIYFGRRSNGLASAARAYFDKDVDKLQVNEAAFLASVINGPGLYDPQYGAAAKARAQARMNYIANNMVEMKWWPEATKAQISKWPDKFEDPKKPRDQTSGPTGYVQNYASSQFAKIMEKIFGGAKDPKTGQLVHEQKIAMGGYKVYTTVDKRSLEETIDQVKNAGFDKSSRRRIALASVKPGDGAIVSLYGGPDFASFQTNYAVLDGLQGGSTYKTFTLLEWLKQGNSTKARLDASSRYFKELDPRKTTDPANYGKDPSNLPIKQRRGTGWYDSHGYTGEATVEQATWASINPVYLQMNLKVEPTKTKEMAENLGLKAPKNIEKWPSNVLGVGDTSPLQMAAAYAAIPAKGKYVKPYIITKIVEESGKVLYDSAANREDRDEHQAFSEGVAADAANALKGVITERAGTAAGAVSNAWQYGGRDIAGKTGTTDNSRTAWFTGFSMNLATSVVMYQPNPKTLNNGTLPPGEAAFEAMKDASGEDEAGGRAPAKVWGMVMQKLHKGLEMQPFPPRAGIGDDKVPPPPVTIPGLPPGFPNIPGMPPGFPTIPGVPMPPGFPSIPGMPSQPQPSFPGQPGGTQNPPFPSHTQRPRPTNQPTIVPSWPPVPGGRPTVPSRPPSSQDPSGPPGMGPTGRQPTDAASG